MKIEVNLNDEWVDEIVTASLRDFIRRDYNSPRHAHQGHEESPKVLQRQRGLHGFHGRH